VRVLGAVRLINRLGSIAPPIANVAMTSPLGKMIARAALGISPKRTLPRFTTPLPRVLGRRAEKQAPRTVLLFGDCFAMYNDSPIGLAAAELLEAFGYRVELLQNGRHGCCARPMISNGLLDDAIKTADKTLVQIRHAVAATGAEAVLTLEPSCCSAMTDDWAALKLGHSSEEVADVVRHVHQVEDFLHDRWDEHTHRPEFETDRLKGEAIFHGHCHHKAMHGPDAGSGLLRRVLGDQLRVLDAGCCGMAGAFGMSAEHYDLSMKIGELALLPAARAATDDDVVLATGTSCRHQIEEGVETNALHPVELLNALLKN
jgi:Fe-S oxidoreductase